MLKKFNNTKGFTLIELMIVIAIIGILAAIAVPQFVSYRMRSYNTAAKAVVHNVKGDEANLNAELGLYGHTEAAGTTLVAAASAAPGAAADSTADNTLIVAATATTAGARLSGLNTGGTRGLNVAINIGANMIAYAWDVNNANDQSTFHVFARHFKGDTAYAIDEQVENVICTVSNATWANVAGLGATAIAPLLAAANADNIYANNAANVSGGGLPTDAWTKLP